MEHFWENSLFSLCETIINLSEKLDSTTGKGMVTKMKKKFFVFLNELAHSEQFWKDRENDLPWVKIQSVYLYMFYKNL